MLQGANLVAAKVQWLLTDIQRGENQDHHCHHDHQHHQHAHDLDNEHDQRSVWERISTACRRGGQLHKEMEAARFLNDFHLLQLEHQDHHPQDHHLHYQDFQQLCSSLCHQFAPPRLSMAQLQTMEFKQAFEEFDKVAPI